VLRSLSFGIELTVATPPSKDCDCLCKMPGCGVENRGAAAEGRFYE
jgi:hypothetical protein